MGLSGQVKINMNENKTVVANIETPEAGLLIGPGGQYLSAFQHLIRLLVRKKTAKAVSFMIDVNEYRSHRLALLREMAETLGQQAKTEQKPIEFAPMSAFERRIIHLVIKEISGINSESQGEGENRYVVVKPASPTS